MVSMLANQVDKRLAKDEDANASGVIINTFGWVEGAGLDILQHCIKVFGVDIVLVMNHDKLFSHLTSTLDGVGTRTIVVKLPSSGGLVTRVCILFLYSLCIHCRLILISVL